MYVVEGVGDDQHPAPVMRGPDDHLPAGGMAPDGRGGTVAAGGALAQHGCRFAIKIERGANFRPMSGREADDITHFPPNDTYNSMDAENAVQSIKFSEDNHQDLDRTREGMMLYGWGDGGGGPTRHMLEVLRRTEDFHGLPRTHHRTSLEFFQRLEKSLTDLPVIEGELYLEYHRGTYTTQAANKRDNRASELALRRVELLSVLAATHGLAYPAAELERLWKLVLLNQFHYILPGSSIAEVYRDSARDYVEVLGSAARLETAALERLPRHGDGAGLSVFNPLGWERRGLVVVAAPHPGAQQTHDGAFLVRAAAPALGAAPLADAAWTGHATLETTASGAWILENDLVRAELGTDGRVHRLMHKASRRETLPASETANRFVIFDDRPIAYDAWDVDAFHLETRKELPGALTARVVESGPLRVGVEFTHAFGPTTIRQTVFLAAGSGHLEFDTAVDWQHRHKFLKVEFPLAVRATEASYEAPFGLARRPTTFNNAHEMARFEVPGHRWADLSEPDFGAAIFTDSKYGYACHGNVLRLSLLRGPTDLDPDADRGAHRFRYALYPHAGDLAGGEVVRRAHEFNQPFLSLPGRVATSALIAVTSPHLIIDTVKNAEDSDAVIVRLYECHGARGAARITSALAIKTAERVNLLEEPMAAVSRTGDGIELEFEPFEIITLKLAR